MSARAAPGPEKEQTGGGPEPVVVDARGLRCPLPVIRLAARANESSPGDLIVLWSTDPAARHDVPAWARLRGHRVLDVDVPRPDDGPRDVIAIAVEVC